LIPGDDFKKTPEKFVALQVCLEGHV